MTATERVFARAGANAEDISVAASRAKGMQYDGEKEVEAYEYGLEQRKKGNGQDLDLLIEAADYLDSIGESGIMEEGIADIKKIAEKLRLTKRSKTSSKRSALLSHISDQKLKNAINEMYRPSAQIGDGGLADAIKHERNTGVLVGGKSHIQKGKERLVNLQRILEKENITTKEKRILEKLIFELEQALKGVI